MAQEVRGAIGGMGLLGGEVVGSPTQGTPGRGTTSSTFTPKLCLGAYTKAPVTWRSGDPIEQVLRWEASKAVAQEMGTGTIPSTRSGTCGEGRETMVEATCSTPRKRRIMRARWTSEARSGKSG